MVRESACRATATEPRQFFTSAERRPSRLDRRSPSTPYRTAWRVSNSALPPRRTGMLRAICTLRGDWLLCCPSALRRHRKLAAEKPAFSSTGKQRPRVRKSRAIRAIACTHYCQIGNIIDRRCSRLLDKHHRLMYFEQLIRATIGGVSVHPRDNDAP